MAACSQCIGHRFKNSVPWGHLTKAANASQTSASTASTLFLYRRALALALEGAADWLHAAPERAFGMVAISYQNLADCYASRGNDERRQFYTEQAREFMRTHIGYNDTPDKTRRVAQEYLNIL